MARALVHITGIPGGVGLAVPAALLTTCAAEPVGHAGNDVRKGLASQVDQESRLSANDRAVGGH
jgi:hypothetical protein